MPSQRLATDAQVKEEIMRLRRDVDSIAEQMKRGSDRFDTLESKIDENTTATKDLVEAWKTATGLVRFVKWMSGFATALVALWVLLRELVKL